MKKDQRRFGEVAKTFLGPLLIRPQCSRGLGHRNVTPPCVTCLTVLKIATLAKDPEHAAPRSQSLEHDSFGQPWALQQP